MIGRTMGKGRLHFIDFARGIVLLLMILGHADITFNLFHYSLEGFLGVYPPIQDIASFWIRAMRMFITPTFFFISGMLIGLNYGKHVLQSMAHSPRLISLRQKGLLLIALEMTLISLLWSSEALLYHGNFFFVFQVIGSFGVAFLFAYYIRRWSYLVLAGVAALFIVSREFVPVVYDGSASIFFNVLTHIFLIPGNINNYFIVEFPVLSWLAIMMLGIAFGKWQYTLGEEGGVRWGSKQYFVASLSLFVVFLIIRGFSDFGNFFGSSWNSVETFFLLSKYPPSLLFTIIGLSGAMLWFGIGAWLSRHPHVYSKILFIEIIGRRPLLVYVLHLTIIRSIGVLFPSLQRFEGGVLVALSVFVFTVWFTLLVIRKIPRTRFV